MNFTHDEAESQMDLKNVIVYGKCFGLWCLSLIPPSSAAVARCLSKVCVRNAAPHSSD